MTREEETRRLEERNGARQARRDGDHLDTWIVNDRPLLVPHGPLSVAVGLQIATTKTKDEHGTDQS